jgi:hypothetical protein
MGQTPQFDHPRFDNRTDVQSIFLMASKGNNFTFVVLKPSTPFDSG